MPGNSFHSSLNIIIIIIIIVFTLGHPGLPGLPGPQVSDERITLELIFISALSLSLLGTIR